MHCLIIDNNPTTVLGLQILIDRQFPNWKLSIAPSCEAALALVQDTLREPIDLVLVDLLPTAANGVAPIAQLRAVLAARAAARLPMLCDIGCVTRVKRHDIAAGTPAASNDSLAPIVSMIGQAMQLVHPGDSGNARAPQPAPDDDVRLTARQKDIVQLVMAGYSNKRIANSLNLSYGTVKNYMFDLMRKFGVTSRLELAIRCQGRHQSASRGDAGTAARAPCPAGTAGHAPRCYPGYGYLTPKPLSLALGLSVVPELRRAA
jgi:two-component system nitrate/nitrite response regulator NarL